MFGKSSDVAPRTMSPGGDRSGQSILQEGVVVRGDLEAKGDVRLDGRLEGKVRVSDRLTVGSSGHVVAEIEAKDVVGDVAGRPCVLIDDMIDTAGTIVAAAEQLIDHGASSVCCAATHGVFSGPAVDRLKNSRLDRVVITNTLPLPADKQFDKVEVLSAAGIIADAIDAVFEDTSVSQIFDGNNLS